jgi:hypothetical protein
VLEALRQSHPEIPEVCFTAAKLLLIGDIPFPLQLERGHNPTIILIWTDISVEVGEVDYEYYDVGRGATDIRHYPHAGGTSVPTELLNLLRENGGTHAGQAEAT